MSRFAPIIPLSFVWCLLNFPAPVRGDEPAEAKLKKLADDSRARAGAIEVKVTAGKKAVKAELHPEPIMKYTDVPRQIEMATLWVWQDEGRPVAIGKVEAYPGKEAPSWLYCFTSASGGLVTAKWPDGHEFQASKAGIEWAALDGPAPKDTAAARLRQMKELFQRFSVRTHDDKLKISDELRPLARPLHEYASPRHGVVQGVLFGVAANGTNPDVIVALEAVSGPDDKRVAKTWRYGVIGMTASGIAVKLDKTEVYTRAYTDKPKNYDNWTYFREAPPKK